MSEKCRREIRFRSSVPEQRRTDLRDEVDNYWKSMGISPHWMLEEILNSWVAAGNSPYTNPFGETDYKTGRILDFWESRLARDQITTLNHILELEFFGKKESLEEILEFTQQSLKNAS